MALEKAASHKAASKTTTSGTAASTSPMIARPRRPAPVLVCRKCLKRADDGREIKRALKSELKDIAKASGEKRAKVVFTSCFGLCPKRAVVMTGGATLARGEFVLVKESDEVGEAVGVLSAK